MVDHPVIDLVGCYTYSSEKIGNDVGTLCGIEPLGVSATDDIDLLLALEPDCVSYMPYRPNFDHLAQILESGANVVTTMYMLAGKGYGDESPARILDAALAGGSSLYSSAVYPGHAAMVALSTSAMCRRIDRISVLESLDISGYANEQMFRAQGFDLEPDDPTAPELVERSCGSFKDQIGVMARALGIRLDGIQFTAEFATADETTDFGFMRLQRGRIAGLKGVISGVYSGRPVIECRFVWKLGEQMTPNWPVTRGYEIEVEGDPNVVLRLQSPEGHFDGPTTTAMPCINAIPAVCAAPPGIVNQMDLPMVRGAYRIR